MRAYISLAICLVASAIAAQDYEIIDRAGRVMATATIQRGRLLVSESTGERISFRREPRYDSADGRFLGYLNVQLQRVLRFPRTGSGVMQVADLDDPNPQFRQTLRSVRPAEVDPIFGYQPSGVVPFGWSGAPWESYPYVSGYRAPLPQSILIDSKTTANAPLAPAKLTLVNGGPREILLTLVDLKTDQPKELRLRPSQRIQVEVQRDAGARRVQRYQTISPTGVAITKEVVAEIPPAVRYEFIVHEWVMQSIAIDRTGKSPSPIEDVNFRGKGLGRFVLPPGNQLQSGTLDVYRAAIAASNRDLVAPITAQEKALGGRLSPLEQAIKNLQPQR